MDLVLLSGTGNRFLMLSNIDWTATELMGQDLKGTVLSKLEVLFLHALIMWGWKKLKQLWKEGFHWLKDNSCLQKPNLSIIWGYWEGFFLEVWWRTDNMWRLGDPIFFLLCVNLHLICAACGTWWLYASSYLLIDILLIMDLTKFLTQENNP